MGSSIGCAELKVIQLTGEQKGEAFVAVNPYGQVPGMSDESNGLNLGESTGDPAVPRAAVQAVVSWHHCRAGAHRYGHRPVQGIRIRSVAQKDSSAGYVGVSYCVLGDEPGANAELRGLYLQGTFVCGDALTIADYCAVVRECVADTLRRRNA